MTTASKAVAEARRLAPIIQRQPWGWNSRVNVQDWAPNEPKYSWPVAGRVDHCGLSLSTVEYNIGLTMHTHFPDSAWTPSGLQWFRDRGLIVSWENIQPGDYVYFRNSGSIYAATHVGMATSRWLGNGFNTIEFNTDHTGLGREFWRTPGYAVAVGRPIYTEIITAGTSDRAPVIKPEPPPKVSLLINQQEEEMPALIEVHKDGDKAAHVAFWLLMGGVPSRVTTDGVSGPPDRLLSQTEFDAWLQGWCIAQDRVQDVAWAGAAARRPVFRPKPPAKN